jgi:hypothetical protein
MEDYPIKMGNIKFLVDDKKVLELEGLHRQITYLWYALMYYKFKDLDINDASIVKHPDYPFSIRLLKFKKSIITLKKTHFDRYQPVKK